jgi:phosphoglycerate dehydrogenase-like enzyme
VRTETPTSGCKIYVGPERLDVFLKAVEDGGCINVTSLAEADAVVWFGREPKDLEKLLPENVRWLQIPDAGAEKWLRSSVLAKGRTVTCASGAYGSQVAEHALALILASSRRLATFARAISWMPQAAAVASIMGAQVTIVGAGGIGMSLIDMLKPFGCKIVAVTRSGRMVPGADISLASSDLDQALVSADVVVLAAPATADTTGLINERALALMKPSAMLINVARGSLIDTRSLIEALDRGHLSAVGLDVTDPEPLPDNHVLFSHPRVLITPHVANPSALKMASFAGLVEENCRRFQSGKPMLGVIDTTWGY